LPLACTAVATDIESGEEVWLREGRLFDAIRASMATPLVFTPFRHGERTLLDGALVNPLPVAPTAGDGTDLTIAVNLGGAAELGPARAKGEGTRGMLDVALASMQTMHDTIARLKLAAHAPDVTVEIPHNACGYHEFWRAGELIALGRERAARALALSPSEASRSPS
jgi:NTE family protein